ncbi:hypothetical protein C1645_831148 [Glomus cerebriforme]|uniref:Uncharacterized protein n=1 Tax=Glomus cerebriforme TaxID=658196 RepID=A0A397SGP1_9GLOM|nr:hypothetical protein C1645_831148 [Glomus cerebriforme]
MELHKNLVKEERIFKVSVQNLSKAKEQIGETAISATTEQESMMDRSGNRWYEVSSKYNGSSQETNKISIQTSKSTVNLDNTLREKSYVSSRSINHFFKIRPSEIPSEGFRHSKLAHASTECEWKSVDTIGTLELQQPNTTNNVIMQELSANNKAQYEKDPPTLLKLLKNKYPFYDETNKNILYDYEIKRFATLYCITNFCLVLSCYDLIFWLKDSDGVIYIWSRTDGMMIRGGLKKAKEEANKWYEENKNTAIKYVITDELPKTIRRKKERIK